MCSVKKTFLGLYCLAALAVYIHMEDFEEKFLNEAALRSYFVYLCKSNSESVDPITDALVVMLTNPVQFTVSRHGLIMFKGAQPYPFTHMDASQRQLLFDMVGSIRCEVPTYSAFALVENPLTFAVENERITFNVNGSKLDPKLVFHMLIELVAKSNRPSHLLFNIMMQRLSARVNISKESLSFVNGKSKEMLRT